VQKKVAGGGERTAGKTVEDWKLGNAQRTKGQRVCERAGKKSERPIGGGRGKLKPERHDGKKKNGESNGLKKDEKKAAKKIRPRANC